MKRTLFVTAYYAAAGVVWVVAGSLVLTGLGLFARLVFEALRFGWGAVG